MVVQKAKKEKLAATMANKRGYRDLVMSTEVTEVCHFGQFWMSYGRCAMSGSPLGMLLGMSW